MRQSKNQKPDLCILLVKFMSQYYISWIKPKANL